MAEVSDDNCPLKLSLGIKRKQGMNSELANTPLWQRLQGFETILFKSEKQYYLLLEGDLDSELEESVLEIHPDAEMDWVYEGTEFDAEKQHGPLLVKLDITEGKSQALLEVFQTEWIKQHLGVILATVNNVTKQDLIQHLQQLRYVRLANIDEQQKILFRWYESRALLGVVTALSEAEISEVLGVIEQVFWCEWTHDQGQWFKLAQVAGTDAKVLDKVIGISPAAVKVMDNYSFDYFSRNLIRELISEGHTPTSFSEQEMVAAVQRYNREAYIKGFSHQDDIKK